MWQKIHVWANLFQKVIAFKSSSIKEIPKMLLFLDWQCEHGFVITMALEVLDI